MRPPAPGEEHDDALRDMAALARCALDGDDAALAMVAQNVARPDLVMGALAGWVAELLQVRGLGREVIDDWQSARGLR